ncbi:MAG: tRNA (guanosine(37)-N1)-methyltransferase TrmD [Methylovulum sp.]|jgi:tRNA (guanine37-N1)-methyltransferase|nr:tRNA (guanosine(37)-N1)-methyltransferase TrmD [Methylovulum sp.]
MQFDVITLFPEMVLQAASHGVTGKALETNLASINVWNPRDYVIDKHKTVDDRPYGGGPGMVMKYQPLHDALTDAKKKHLARESSKVIYLSPQGKVITQQVLSEALNLSQIILVAGRYEGIDERFIMLDCDEEWSLGDYVISGGELAALIVIDAMLRLIPGVLGDSESALYDSHSDGLLDYPHYTRPETIAALTVPTVLTSGHHADIDRWRHKQALGRTWQKRPDLLKNKQLNAEQKNLLNEFILESNPIKV